ncbi:cell wall-binding repeat-containing protein [Euzebya sp.]|uniref:cell wall-binding repeat-containing protein n=1 Tax=Euzebya sp. TaxID=1971409 RepID=UPI003519CC09
MQRRDPDDQQGWGDVPTSALEHPYVRLLQVLAFALVVFLGLNQLGLLDDTPDALRTTRITGEDPVSAAASVARQSHGGGAPTVVLAGIDALADGVVATGLAGAVGAPILLNESGGLNPQTRDVLRELDTERVFLIGGTNALSADVARVLEEDLDLEVVRVAGGSRFDTASRVADLVAAETEPAEIDGLRSALVVPAEDVAAALEAGSIAASRATPMPVLISQGGRLPEPTVAAIERLGIEQLVVVAGTGAGAGAVEQDFDGPVRVVEGVNGAADLAIDIRDFRPPRAVVVPAGDQARTLIAGPLAGRESGVILTADTAQSWLAENCGTLGELFVVGEEDEVTDAQVEAAEIAATDCGEDA